MSGPLSTGALVAMRKRELTKSMEMLLGMVTGMVADAHLHDLEIQLLSTWLAANEEAASLWPVSVIATKVREILVDGVVTEEERAHLLQVLQQLASTNFAETGSVTPEVVALPIDDSVDVLLAGSLVCHTGKFLYGPRPACERLTQQAGGIPQDAITSKTGVLVVGTEVSPSWVHTPFGRKIQRAAEMRAAGHPIRIISEQRWLEVLGHG